MKHSVKYLCKYLLLINIKYIIQYIKYFKFYKLNLILKHEN